MASTGNPLGERVAEAFGDLLARGYRVEQERHDPRDFGNALVVLAAGDVRVRVVRERGQEFVELASAAEPEDWFESALLLDVIRDDRRLGGTPIDLSSALGSPIRDLDAAGAALARLDPVLRERFAPERQSATREALRDRAAARARQRFGAALPPRDRPRER